jgi:hypothetical protein
MRIAPVIAEASVLLQVGDDRAVAKGTLGVPTVSDRARPRGQRS